MSAAEDGELDALALYRRNARFECAYAMTLPEVHDAIVAAVPSDVRGVSGHCFYRDNLGTNPCPKMLPFGSIWWPWTWCCVEMQRHLGGQLIVPITAYVAIATTCTSLPARWRWCACTRASRMLMHLRRRLFVLICVLKTCCRRS